MSVARGMGPGAAGGVGADSGEVGSPPSAPSVGGTAYSARRSLVMYPMVGMVSGPADSGSSVVSGMDPATTQVRSTISENLLMPLTMWVMTPVTPPGCKW